ncbi:MAG TPA: Hpt domain-containing protein, partial [Burkholderiaceae bacterium]
MHKTLRRMLRDGDSRTSTIGFDVGGAGNPQLKQAALQLHQVAGVLSLVGLPAGSAVLRAGEGLVTRFATNPVMIDHIAVETIEKANFALLALVAKMLAGGRPSTLSLFPAYRDLQDLASAERIHPADLWQFDWYWRELANDARPLSPAMARTDFETTLLKQMRQPNAASATTLSELCAGLAAGASEPALRCLWQLGAAQFEAQAAGLLPSDDAYVKRLGSRLLTQLRHASVDASTEQLGRDLLFFCAQASAPNANQAPRLHNVLATYQLGADNRGNYEDDSLGRIDPAWVAQAKRRVGVAKESWSVTAEGEKHRLEGLDEQFAAVSESLAKLFPQGEVLGEALQRAVVATLRSGQPPAPALAMEIATAILYVEAALEDAAFDQIEQQERVQRMARRIGDVARGEPSQPLETWMEELYRRVSDRQTLGSVVHELRQTLADIEKRVDEYFRAPAQREVLIAVPGLLQSMRGVLKVLGLDQAALCCQRMQTSVDELANTEVDATAPAARGLFERIANNLGALGFLIDMLSVQPALAKRMFAYDEASGQLAPVMGRHEDAEPPLSLPQPTPPAPPPAPLPEPAFTLDFGTGPVAAPAAPSEPEVVDAEMLEIFLEEAGEVTAGARESLVTLDSEPQNLEALTTVRRAFHTLKGSA